MKDKKRVFKGALAALLSLWIGAAGIHVLPGIFCFAAGLTMVVGIIISAVVAASGLDL